MKTWKICVFSLLITLCTSAHSGSYQGKVTSVFASGGKVFVAVSHGHFDNSTTCTGKTTGLSFWLDPATDYGKALLSIALTAKSTGQLVWALGNNTCISGPSSGTSEQLAAIDLKG